MVGLGDGRTVKIIHHPIATGGWVGTHDDVTEREQLSARLEQQNQLLVAKEEQLRTQNIHLDAALNNMVQGLAMFDAGHRLVLCNRRFIEIYGLSPEQARVGTTLRQLIEHRFDNGLASDRSPQELMDQLLRKRDARDFEQLLSQLGDGRSHRHHRAADGRRRHGHDPPGHHRAAPLRGQDRPHGAARCADRPAQPRAAQRAAASMR